MVLNRKHFEDAEEMVNLDRKGEQRPNSAVAWRRLMIEKATANVRKAFEAKTDLMAHYQKGELLFDEEANKFGRVEVSSPGFLTLSLLAGGTLERRDEIPLDFVRKNRHHLTLPQMASELFLSEIEVIVLLNEIEREPEPKPKQVARSTKKPTQARTKKAPVVKSIISAGTKANLNRGRTKPAIKIAAKKSSASARRSTIKSTMPITFAKLIPKGATTDPVVDPNGYIQQNFLLMSNKELAVATSLSEHTIRRKMGEWGLKRKDFVNKA